jgi:hypothetical protein
MENYLFQFTLNEKDDRDAIDLAFNHERANDRKEWLKTPALSFEDFIN